MWNGWLVGQPAGWLAGCLAASVENRPTPIHSSSLSSYVRVSLFIYMRKTRVWKMRVCVAPKKKRAEGWRRVTCSRVEERRRNEGGFRKEEIFQLALPSDQVEGWDAKFSFFSPLFFFFWLRFAFFGRANVILIARLSVLLCEFARHFFISFPREIADAEEGETSSRFLAPLACEFVRRNENSPHPSVPHLFVR